MNSKHFSIRLHSRIAAIFTLLTLNLSAQDANQTFLDPAKAGPDYAIQGEYSGTIEGNKAGAQVIARGNGKFDYAVYHGGLPGDGWNRGEILRGSLEAKDGVISTTIDGAEITLKDGKITAGDDANLEKVERKSPTIGAKAPEGAIILFDGKNTDAWKKGAKMTEDGLLQAGVTSKENFGAFKFHIEFFLPFKPFASGQGRGNSGFYAQGRYEVQMLDSFGLTGENNECGGVYTIGKPDQNMCFPPLAWQTYDIDFTPAEFDADGKKTKNAKMTVLHNGVEIHKDLDLTHSTTASPLKEGPEGGPVYLQDHGNPVFYRNMWIVKK
jgi:hypothetical protein